MTEKQRQYLERVGNVVVHDVDEAGWMLVEFKPPIEVAATVAEFERYSGERAEIADRSVWVDTLGREHFGPGEAGYDRFELN